MRGLFEACIADGAAQELFSRGDYEPDGARIAPPRRNILCCSVPASRPRTIDRDGARRPAATAEVWAATQAPGLRESAR